MAVQALLVILGVLGAALMWLTSQSFIREVMPVK